MFIAVENTVCSVMSLVPVLGLAIGHNGVNSPH